MKTFVLFALTLCVAHGEMSRKVFAERGQRSKSKLDQGSHHRPGVAGAGRSIRQFFRKKFGHHKAFPDFRSSSRVARSVAVKEHGSGHLEYVMGNIAGSDLAFGSGSSSGLGSGFGSGSSLTVPITLTGGIKTEESQTGSKSKKMHENHSRKAESSNSNGGIINVLTPPSRKVKRSIAGLAHGFRDTGSGSSSGEVYNVGGVQESSGSEIIEEVINPDAVKIQYAQGGGESVATSTGSGSVACVGVSCDQGSGSVEKYDAQIKLANSSVQRNSVPGEEFLSSGMYAVAHQP